MNLLISRWGSLDDEIVLAVELIDGEAIGTHTNTHTGTHTHIYTAWHKQLTLE